MSSQFAAELGIVRALWARFGPMVVSADPPRPPAGGQAGIGTHRASVPNLADRVLAAAATRADEGRKGRFVRVAWARCRSGAMTALHDLWLVQMTGRSSRSTRASSSATCSVSSPSSHRECASRCGFARSVHAQVAAAGARALHRAPCRARAQNCVTLQVVGGVGGEHGRMAAGGTQIELAPPASRATAGEVAGAGDESEEEEEAQRAGADPVFRVRATLRREDMAPAKGAAPNLAADNAVVVNSALWSRMAGGTARQLPRAAIVPPHGPRSLDSRRRSEELRARALLWLSVGASCRRRVARGGVCGGGREAARS